MLSLEKMRLVLCMALERKIRGNHLLSLIMCLCRTFSEASDVDQLPLDLITINQALVICAYGGNESDTLTDLRTQTFLAGKTGLLLALSPTSGLPIGWP